MATTLDHIELNESDRPSESNPPTKRPPNELLSPISLDDLSAYLLKNDLTKISIDDILRLNWLLTALAKDETDEHYQYYRDTLAFVRNIIGEQYHKLFYTIMFKVTGRRRLRNEDDFLSVISFTLVNCLNSYNPTVAQFSSYFVRAGIIACVQHLDLSRKLMLESNFDMNLSNDMRASSGRSRKITNNDILIESMINILRSGDHGLDEYELRILKHRYRIGDINNLNDFNFNYDQSTPTKNLRELGAMFNRSYESARLAETRALRKLGNMLQRSNVQRAIA